MLQDMDITLRQTLLIYWINREVMMLDYLVKWWGWKPSAINIAWCGRGGGQPHPTQDILKWWQQNASPTVKDLVEFLKEMGRKDALGEIYEVYPDLQHGS